MQLRNETPSQILIIFYNTPDDVILFLQLFFEGAVVDGVQNIITAPVIILRQRDNMCV